MAEKKLGIEGEDCPKCRGTGINRKRELCGYHRADVNLLERYIQRLLEERDCGIL